MRFLIACIFVFSFSILSSAQGVIIKEDYLVKRLMERYVELNRSGHGISGWRIQLLATTDRTKMEKAKENFQAKYPTIPVTWVHASPYFKLRAGAYESKLMAIQILQQLKSDFPSAYPAKDNNINPVEFLSSLN